MTIHESPRARTFSRLHTMPSYESTDVSADDSVKSNGAPSVRSRSSKDEVGKMSSSLSKQQNQSSHDHDRRQSMSAAVFNPRRPDRIRSQSLPLQ
jgi:hypothetical protein